DPAPLSLLPPPPPPHLHTLSLHDALPIYAVAEKYGVWGPKKFMGREYIGLHRMSFIIDRDGKLRHIIEKVNTKTHHDEVLNWIRSEEHTSELQSRENLVCRLLLETKKAVT